MTHSSNRRLSVLQDEREGLTEQEAVSDDEDTRFPDEKLAARDALLESISVLTRVLKVFGLYFRQTGAEQQTESVQNAGLSHNSSHRSPISVKWKSLRDYMQSRWCWMKFYSCFVMTLLWFNVARFLLVFDSNEKINTEITSKLTVLAWMLMAAVTHTSCVVACWSGRLDRVISDLRVTDDFIKRISRRSTINCIVASIAVAAQFIFIEATIFIDSPHFELFYVPFAKHIPAGLGSYGFKMSCLLVLVFVSASWILPQALNHTLATILVLLYGELDAKFAKAVDADGRFNGNIRTFRRRHQAICRGVKTADRFVMISNVAGFICHIFTVILYLFSLVVFTSNADKLIILYFYAGLIGNVVGLALTTFNGIRVNEMLNMFQRRLTGHPIGFSVLGIFIISRKTVLSLLGVLITYFLLAIRMYKSFTAAGANKTCNADSWNTTGAITD